MPELPEVETTTKGLKSKVLNLTIKGVWTDLDTKDKRKHDTVANPKYFNVFKKEVPGKKIVSVQRIAKNILINLSSGKSILIHLKMTGHLLYGDYQYDKKENKWLPSNKEGSEEAGEEGSEEVSASPSRSSSTPSNNPLNTLSSKITNKTKNRNPLSDPFNRFVHFVFLLSNGKSLAFSDMRKFGKITLIETVNAKKNQGAEYVNKHLKNIGPDPLSKSFDFFVLKERLQKKPLGKIKSVLMDQGIIAGIGNIYSDEILCATGIHPERKSETLNDKEIKSILRAMKKILKKGIDLGGDSMSDYRDINGKKGRFQLHHKVYRRTGEKCLKKNCKGKITRKIVNGRSAHFCDSHQK